MIPIRILAIGLAFALAVASSSPASGASDLATRPVLVIDFTGLNDTDARAHANQFAQWVLPEASVATIGIHGIVPDRWRKSAGFSAIVALGNASEQAEAASKAYALTKASDRTILAFDINESIIPQQVRSDMPGWLSWAPGWVGNVLRATRLLPNKTEGPAAVAAMVVARWKQEHPDGVVVIRGHSDGTWATLATLERLKTVGVAPDAVVLESVRQDYEMWDRMAQQFRGTRFFDLSARNDLPPVGLMQSMVSPTFQSNWSHIHVDEALGALKAHGVMTDWSTPRRLAITNQDGTTTVRVAALGDIITDRLRGLFVSGAKDMLRRDVSPRTAAAVPPEQAPAVASELRQLRHGLPINKRAAEQLLDLMRALAKSQAKDERQPVHSRALAQSFIGIDKVARSLQKDIETSRGTHFTVLRSRTLEAFGSLGLDLLKSSDALAAGGRYETLAPWIARAIAVKSWAAALGQIAGGQYDPGTIKLVVEGASKLAVHEILADVERSMRAAGVGNAAIKTALKPLEAKMLAFDAVAPIAEAVAMRGAAGMWTIEAVDKMSDGIITAAVSVLMLPAAGLVGPVAAIATREIVVEALKSGRDASGSMPLWSYLQAKIWATGNGVLDLYSQYQAAQVRRGQRADDIDALYGLELLYQTGLSDAEIAASKEQNRLFNTRTAMEMAKRNAGSTVTAKEPEAKPSRDEAKVAIVAREPEIPGHREQSRLKPWRNELPPLPPPGRFWPPGSGGGGGGGQSGAAGSGRDDRDPPEPPQGRVPLGGVTVDPSPQFERMDRTAGSAAAIQPGETP